MGGSHSQLPPHGPLLALGRRPRCPGGKQTVSLCRSCVCARYQKKRSVRNMDSRCVLGIGEKQESAKMAKHLYPTCHPIGTAAPGSLALPRSIGPKFQRISRPEEKEETKLPAPGRSEYPSWMGFSPQVGVKMVSWES